MPDVGRDLVERVVERTLACTITVWGFGVGGALAGLVRASRTLSDGSYVQWVADLITPALNAPPEPTDHLIPVEALVTLRQARPGLAVDGACTRWANAVLTAPRLTPGGPRVHRPDLPPWSSTIWVDCMHTDGPGLALLGRFDEAVVAAEEYAAVLQRDDGLFHHGYDVAAGRGNEVAWGRGQGWALIGLVETLRAVPNDDLRVRLARLVEALARHEDAGCWHTIIDDPTSPLEHSTAAYVALAVARAVDAGLVDPAFAALAERAWDATVAVVEPAGGLEVSEATPVGDATTYRERATGVFSWGQGPVIHAGLDRLERPTQSGAGG